jgi:hypothetical protein
MDTEGNFGVSDLIELAARCEAASGSDRALDAKIAAILRVGTKAMWAQNYPLWIPQSDGRVVLGTSGPHFVSPAYTASLDAAMTLVPEGMAWTLDGGDPNCMCSAALGPVPQPGRMLDATWQGEGETPALAMIAAILRAGSDQ